MPEEIDFGFVDRNHALRYRGNIIRLRILFIHTGGKDGKQYAHYSDYDKSFFHDQNIIG